MIDKIIELKNRYVPAKFALDHLVDYARKGGGTVAGAHKVLLDFLECVATLTAAQPAALPVPVYDLSPSKKELLETIAGLRREIDGMEKTAPAYDVEVAIERLKLCGMTSNDVIVVEIESIRAELMAAAGSKTK